MGTPGSQILHEDEFTTCGSHGPVYRLVARDKRHIESFLRMDAYRAAMAFVRGEIDIEGDLVAAVAARTTAQISWKDLWLAAWARCSPSRLETFFQTRARAAQNIRHHYDFSDEFYRQMLDPRMVYSCAYFQEPNWSLERAQLAKLDHICRKLDLGPGERLLDVGCGWGALVFHAAESCGALATGCTLSKNQAEYATNRMAEAPPEERISIVEADYRNLTGVYDKIASVGMFEHVGRHRLGAYFRKMESLLSADGLFLNHGICRPQSVSDDAETLFLRGQVFPGGELPHLSDVVRVAESAGFEVLDVENLRPHYAMTCRAWVRRLQANASSCLQVVDAERYRTWLLYLAASAFSFESGQTDVYQVLLAKRASRGRKHLTRDYMYRSV